MASHHHFPEIISVVFYKYNSIDNKLYTYILDNCQFRKHKGSYLVRAEDLKNVLYKHFKSDIDRISLLSPRELHKEANTVYFLYKIFSEMKNLRWFQMTLSKNAKYDRINLDEEAGTKSVNFNFKVIRGSFRTFDLFKEEDVVMVNDILQKIGAIKNVQYSLVKLNSLISRLESTAATAENEKIRHICGKLINHFDIWAEDDPETLIVTDFLDI